MRRAINDIAYKYHQAIVKQANSWDKVKDFGSNMLNSPGSAAAVLAGAGALGGGAIGAVANKKRRIRGAIIGALTGAGAGGIAGAGIGHFNKTVGGLRESLYNANEKIDEVEAARLFNREDMLSRLQTNKDDVLARLQNLGDTHSLRINDIEAIAREGRMRINNDLGALRREFDSHINAPRFRR